MELKEIIVKYPDSFIILGGDFNVRVDGTLDGFPPRSNDCLHLKCSTSALCSEQVLGTFFHPNLCDFTWSNRNRSSQSRIDLFLLSSSAFQFVNYISHSFAPLSVHKQIRFKMSGNINELPSLRDYRKFNNSILKDTSFNDSIKNLILGIFSKNLLMVIK